MDFDRPLEIHSVPADGPLVFTTTEAFDEWVARQIKNWTTLYVALYSSAQMSPLRRVLDTQVHGWTEMRFAKLELLSRPNDLGKPMQFDISQLVNQRLADLRLICGSHPMIVRAVALVKHDSDVAGYLILMVSGDIKHELSDPDSLGYRLGIYARAIVALSDTGSLAKVLSDMSVSAGRANDMLLKADADHHAFRSLAGRKMKVLSRASRMAVAAATRQRRLVDAEWERLRAAYDANLKLRAPRQYWEIKLEKHQKLSSQWSKAFAIIGFTGVVIAGSALWFLSRIWTVQSVSLGTISWVLPATILGIPLFLTLWLLRVCGRQWSDHVMRQEDARERVVMIETFLALSRDTDSPNAVVDPGHLAIILNSVFRPGPGFLSDDSPPAGLLDAALARLGSQRSG